MSRRDWLLLLLALSDASRPLDPVRLQKGMFLLAKEGGIPEREQYSFLPYDYGPFSATIYSDLEDLVSAGLVEEETVPGYTWHRYRVTPEGLRSAQVLVNQLDSDERESARRLAALKRHVLSLGFQRLLRHVYDRYPEYARNSVFTR